MPPLRVRKRVLQPEAFEQLDRHINDPVKGPSFDASLAAGRKQGFTGRGPFAGQTRMKNHWSNDWTSRGGHGGKYWPYLKDVDVRGQLTSALSKSVGRAVKTGKVHNTLWVIQSDVPEEARRGEPVSKTKQRQLFKVAVEETPGVVNLVILTPQPM